MPHFYDVRADDERPFIPQHDDSPVTVDDLLDADRNGNGSEHWALRNRATSEVNRSYICLIDAIYHQQCADRYYASFTPAERAIFDARTR